MVITARPRPVFCVFRPKIPCTFYFKLTEQSSREKLAAGGFEPCNARSVGEKYTSGAELAGLKIEKQQNRCYIKSVYSLLPVVNTTLSKKLQERSTLEGTAKMKQNHIECTKKTVCLFLIIATLLPVLAGCATKQAPDLVEEPNTATTPNPSKEEEPAPIIDPLPTGTTEPEQTEEPAHDVPPSQQADPVEVIEGTSSEDEPMQETEPEEQVQPPIIQEPVPDVTVIDDGLTPTQRNSINMLNYLTVLTQQINDSKGSRLFLEQAYSSMINNTFPNAVDTRTQAQMISILDTLENYRMIDVKRERLEYIYQQNCAQAYRQAIPSPMSILNVVQSGNLLKAAVSVIYMAVDSKASYESYKDQTDLQYLQDGWELDDAEAAELHNSRKQAFTYMLSMVRDNELPGDYALNEESVQNFVSWTNNPNVTRRIAFLESSQETYQAFGTYWITLAKSYYEAEDYEKCLEAIAEYEKISSRIFRKDYDYAELLPMGIVAAKETCSKDEYIKIADAYTKAILNNTDISDWSLRYFVAQINMDLFAQTKNEEYLKAAYQIAYDNVNFLVDGQRELNAAYIADIVQKEAPDGAVKREKEEVKQYNKMLKEERKTELPPISEALYLNCDLLFALADKLGITNADKQKIDKILHENGESIFLVKPLDEKFWYAVGANTVDERNMDIVFSGAKITLPAMYISDDAKIKVTVTSNGEKTIFDDWTIKEVDRPKNSEYVDFLATFTSEKADKFDFSAGDTIKIEITPVAADKDETYVFSFKTVAVKKALVFNGVAFERV